MDGQSVDDQADALRAAGAAVVVREAASGARSERAEFRRVVAAIESGDVSLVTRLDRLAGSVRDLLDIMERIAKAGAGFRSLGDPWADTTTQGGDPMLAVLGGLAEFERALIRVRAGEGRKRAKARGVLMGRRPKLTPAQQREALQRRQRGEAVREIARDYGVSHSTISRLGGDVPAPAMDEQTARAAEAFMRRIRTRYPVRAAFLYGSRARQTHRPDSDADIAIVLEGERANHFAVVQDMAGAAFDTMLETGVNVQALPLWEREFSHSMDYSNPALLENIRREGIRL